MRLLRILRFRQKNVMKFEKITQENIDLLKPYLYACPHQMCGYSPLVLTMWSDYFDYRYALCRDTLFLKMRDESGAQYFLCRFATSKTESSCCVSIVAKRATSCNFSA